MTTFYLRIGLLACLFLCTAALTGCVKFKQVVTVMPDGSGKIALDIGLSENMIQMAKSRGADPFREMRPSALSQDAKGIVAFSKPVQREADGFVYISFDAYFEDVNAVELGSPDEQEPPMRFVYARNGDAATLDVQHSMILSAVAEHEPIRADEKQDAAEVIAGLVFTERYVLPGRVRAFKGLSNEGNTATLEMTQAHMLDSSGPIKDLAGVSKLSFKIDGVTEDAEAMAAFKAELDAAKKAWQAMKQEAKAEAEAAE